MAYFCNESKYEVSTKDGPVLGYLEKNGEGAYYKFKGIPYAKPPIGPLRFLPPSPVKPWTEVIDCSKDPPEPLSYDTKVEIIKSEDCLYLEVSTPNIKPDKPLPVMFWIGSYGFTWSIDSFYDPTFIIKEDVIYVRCGYRWGPFGFLSINTLSAPGNNGLKDVVMALKWVQKNISVFGGDPNNVTIFGNSGGAAFVHFMMLSPMASGLFHKAIMQSGSALNNWSLDKNPSQSVMELAKELGITTKCKFDVIEELKLIPALDIMAAWCRLEHALIEDTHSTFDTIFKPCIEQEFEGQPAFLTKSPPLILKSNNFNKVPLIIGCNNIEGCVLQFIKQNLYDYEKYNENVSLLVPKALSFELKYSKEIGNKLLKFYLGGEEFLREDTKTQYLQLVTDYYFLYYVNKTVRLHSQLAPECPIYYYIVNYAGEWSVPDGLKHFNSAGHCAETPFIFGIKNTPELVLCRGSRDSVTTRKRVVKMWTNFAKYGNPTPNDDDPLLQITWDPVENPDKLNYLSIGSELTKGRNPYHERMAFWEELHKDYQFLRVLVYFSDMGVSC